MEPMQEPRWHDNAHHPILIVDDDPVQRRLSEATLLKAGFAVQAVPDGAAALEHVRDHTYSAILLDMMMPGVDGPGVLEGLARQGIATPVVVLTAQGSIESAVRMVRAGAFDFLVKPVSPDRLTKALSAAVKMASLEPRARMARSRAAERFSIDDLVTKSPWMEKVIRLAQRAAASDIPVLIEGESGVGKEMVARAIQANGDRRTKPFITVNCGAIPANLVESILFGHEKGAFTGAVDRHDGKFLEADGGTLFLDEIGELPAEVQVKLLRAVQFNEIDPVGAKRPRQIDVRLISATNKNLIEEIKSGRFREDLFYRLNVFPIFVPPLRERREDIAQLASLFLKRHAAVTPGCVARAIGVPALRMLEAHDWPGNVRELENAIHRAVVLADASMLLPEHFPQIAAQSITVEPPVAEPTTHALQSELRAELAAGGEIEPENLLRLVDRSGHVRRMEDIEAEVIRLSIAHYGGQLSEVARRLGIGRSTLYRKISELGLDGNGQGMASRPN
jgi:DNA-binding NtrC family response regulator